MVTTASAEGPVMAHQPSSPPSSPLSVLSNSPSLPPSPLDLDASKRYPSPSVSSNSSQISAPPSGSTSPTPDIVDGDAIQVRTDGPPPAKRRRIATPKSKPRTTEHIDLETLTAGDEVQLDRLLAVLRKKKRIVVIAGAGISVSAGIPDFRSSTGLFSTLRGQHKLKASGKHLFDASVYKHDSSTSSFHTMVRELAHMTNTAQPTAFHHMLASIAHEGRLMRLYSQNVDCIDTQMAPLATKVPLNVKGPWPATIQLHGGLEKMVCTKCGQLEPFDGSLFEGPEAPLCEKCREQDQVRTAFAGKRSHGIGRLRPRIVLYNEYNPDEEAIGNVSKADLRRVPDAVVVVGTSLKIPGVRRIVKEMCQVTRSRRDGFTAWVNIDPEPQGAEFKDCWDMVVRGKSDDVASLVNLPHWDEQDIGESYEIDEKRDQWWQEHLRRVRLDVEVPQKPSLPDDESVAGSEPGAETPSGAKSRLVEQLQNGIPTPSASPKLRSPLPVKPTTQSKSKQGKLLFPGQPGKSSSGVVKAKPARSQKPRQSGKDKAKPKVGLMGAFKTTKSTAPSSGKKTPVKPVQKLPSDPASSDLSSPVDLPDKFSSALPSLRPSTPIREHDSIIFKQEPDILSSELASLPSTPTTAVHRPLSSAGTISPQSKPQSLSHLID